MLLRKWKCVAYLFCVLSYLSLLLYILKVIPQTKLLKPGTNCSCVQRVPKINHTKIVIGAVSCRNESLPYTNYNPYTITMLKSVLISAQRDKLSQVDIHLFTEHGTDAEYIKQNVLVQHRYKGSRSLTVNIYNYSAVKVVPEIYRPQMIYNWRFRCGYVRLFFPHALPNIDSIIHLDSDMIVTGSILKLWNEFERMDSTQMLGLGYNRHPDNDLYPRSDSIYQRFPSVSKRGLNAALLVMNLTRLRKFGLEEKSIQAYKDYSQITRITGQSIVNILSYYNPTMYQIMPCHLHFVSMNCEIEWFCQEANKDPQGIHLVHGLKHTLEEGRTWNKLYNIYSRFNVSSATADFFTDVVIPTRQYYSELVPYDLCYGTVNETLFKDYF